MLVKEETLRTLAQEFRAGKHPQFYMGSTDTCIGGIAWLMENPGARYSDARYSEQTEAVKSVRSGDEQTALFWPDVQGDTHYGGDSRDQFEAADAIEAWLAGNHDNPWGLVQQA